ncbi:hypothetical protein BW723_08710 [Polaribacter reichenbachii]|uniref:Uncharacterized protein n=1 Tax=Polaribacter reichenbachii TaxID=996801 RepID=A0A1B8U713_9FLAO|nr:hypothetical protein [Polaribacter reichenbachii]APZ46373.1 hypothetical protein BW723_08710 [Polaribacter reichenbachii]AUC20237.1 hypothetical protein BTO17_16740 [Polaribacter reichenbachii]OBY67673.1 hypothetical protein LPB301_00795 [Polaribacter reichenbachii]
MNKDEFLKLSKELQELSKNIPLNWGNIQNDITDAKINLFKIRSKNQLENKIKPLSNTDKNYYRRRWFLWQCARVDEYLFYSQNDILKNPNAKDKDWDIEFDNNKNLRFDLKGTIVPKKLRANFTFSDEEKIINYYYQNQSKGVRNHIQNRLFIVHHSFYDNKRCLFLRCHWNLKVKAYQHFIKLLQNEINYVSYKNVIAKCIFIFESENNEFSFKII